ncbi:hypothetical protein Hamer_G026711, partial [Homarus americanus]
IFPTVDVRGGYVTLAFCGGGSGAKLKSKVARGMSELENIRRDAALIILKTPAQKQRLQHCFSIESVTSISLSLKKSVAVALSDFSVAAKEALQRVSGSQMYRVEILLVTTTACGPVVVMALSRCGCQDVVETELVTGRCFSVLGHRGDSFRAALGISTLIISPVSLALHKLMQWLLRFYRWTY